MSAFTSEAFSFGFTGLGEEKPNSTDSTALQVLVSDIKVLFHVFSVAASVVTPSHHCAPS